MHHLAPPTSCLPASLSSPKAPPAVAGIGWRTALVGLALLAACGVVFAPVLTADFIRYDDNLHLFENPWMQPVTAAHVLHFWRSSYGGLYIPVCYTVLAGIALLAHRDGPVRGSISGPSCLDPRPFHDASLLAHAVNVLLVYALLRRLRCREWTAGTGALLFAIHPLQVESVAWISELRGLLAALFCLAALHLAWPSAPDSSLSRKTGLARAVLAQSAATLCFAAALLCKPSAVALPAISWALDVYLRAESGARGWKAARPRLVLLAWLVLGGAAAWLTHSVQALPASVGVAAWQRPLVACDALAFYARHLVWPAGLAIDYGRTPSAALRDPLACAAAVLLVIAIGAATWAARRRWPHALLGAAVFAMALAPVSGLAAFAFQSQSTVADRYAYFALLGPSLLLALALERGAATARSPRVRLAAGVALGCAAVGLGLQSAALAECWQNGYALFLHGLDMNPRSSVSAAGLGNALADQGDLTGAASALRRAADLNPGYDQAWFNLGVVETWQGDKQAAVKDYARAVAITPRYLAAQGNLGVTLVELGQPAAGLAALRRAEALNPSLPAIHERIGGALLDLGQRRAARAEFAQAARCAPGDANAAKLLANARNAP